MVPKQALKGLGCVAVLSSAVLGGLGGCIPQIPRDHDTPPVSADYLRELSSAEEKRVRDEKILLSYSEQKSTLDNPAVRARFNQYADRFFELYKDSILTNPENPLPTAPQETQFSGLRESIGNLGGIQRRMDELSYPFVIKITGTKSFSLGWHTQNPQNYIKLKMDGGLYIQKEFSDEEVRKIAEGLTNFRLEYLNVLNPFSE